MSKCFDKNVVKHDATSEPTTTYRPIDKYANVLPHLIGSDEWNRKWHAGILDKDPAIERRRQTSTTSHDDELQQPSSSLAKRDSLESVAKSVSSAGGEQMVINSLQPSGIMLCDNDEAELDPTKVPVVPASSSMFRPLPDQRRIVNLFNDEPPSLESSPSAVKRPVNLFDDYGSVDSFPTSETSEEQGGKSQAPAAAIQPPVDLFNDNEFESFIGKLEQKQQQVDESEPSKSVKTSSDKNPIVGDMKRIADEIKKVQLRKVGGDGDAVAASAKLMDEKKSSSTAASSAKSLDFKQMLSKQLEKKPSVGDVKTKPKMDAVKTMPTPPPPHVETKVKKTVANLFDDDDDTEVAVAPAKEAPKSAEKPKEAPKKSKLTNLFDDDDDDDDFLASIVKKRSEAMPSKPITTPSAVSTKLFTDEHDGKSISTSSKTKSLFDDEHEEVKVIPAAVKQTREAIKTLSEMEKTSEEEKHIEKVAQPKIDAEEHSRTISNTSRVVEKVTNTPPPSSRVEQLSEKVDEAEKLPKRDENQSTTQFSVPFLSDEPPDDDTWPNDDNNVDEHDNRVMSFSTPKTFNYPTVPLFDELPPEDDFIVSKQPPIPEPNFYSEDEEPPVKNESPKKVEKPKSSPTADPISSGIRGKLDDLFKKQQEKDAANVKDKEAPKKLAGKLSDMKINVGALMPGMRPPPSMTRKSTEEKSPDASPEKMDEGSEKHEKVTKSPTKATDVSNNDERLNLLNNDISKSRAKIQVKRRPSTRQARQESYQKTMSAYIAEDESKDEKITTTTRPLSSAISEEIVRKSVEFTETKSVVSSKKILSSSIFGDESDSEDILVGITRKETMTTETLTSKSNVVTNKIPVFYDDEADTKKMLDEQKEKQKDDNIKKSSIFDDESDDDLFGKKPKKSTATKQPAPKSATNKSQSLFGDEDDGENVFKAKSTKTATSSSLFESDDEKPATSQPAIASSSKTKTEKSTAKSLFGDDDDDDDDLFSSKPKCELSFRALSCDYFKLNSSCIFFSVDKIIGNFQQAFNDNRRKETSK